MRLANGPTFRRYPNKPRVNNTTKAESRRAPAAKATFALRVFHQGPCFPDNDDAPNIHDEIPGSAACCRSTVALSPSPMAAGVGESASGQGAGDGLWLSGRDENDGDPSLGEESAIIKTSCDSGVVDSHTSPLTLISRRSPGRGGEEGEGNGGNARFWRNKERRRAIIRRM